MPDTVEVPSEVLAGPPSPPVPERAQPPAALRYFVAGMFILYGFAKLMGAQFTSLDSQLDRPMREVPGFWLTWYYFGYSAVYGSLLALGQIGGAILLTFRRTTLLGAAILFAMVSNIVLIDLFYGVDLGGTATAVVLWICLLFILGHYRAELLDLFWRARFPEDRAERWGVGLAARAGVLVIAASFMYWVANHNNRAPTPLDGTWRVTGAPADSLPLRIYFERNRAHMAVFQYPTAQATHHFEVDPQRRSMRIWRTWLTRGEVLFSGTYSPSADRIELDGRFGTGGAPVHMRLVRVRQRR